MSIQMLTSEYPGNRVAIVKVPHLEGGIPGLDILQTGLEASVKDDLRKDAVFVVEIGGVRYDDDIRAHLADHSNDTVGKFDIAC